MQEAPVGAFRDNLLRSLLDHPNFVQAQCKEASAEGSNNRERKAGACLENHSVDFEGLDQFQEISSSDPQDLGCGGAIPSRLSESLQDRFSFGGIHSSTIREGIGAHSRLGGNDARRQIMERDPRFLAQHDGSLHHIGQLAHVSRPIIGEELFLSVLGDLGEALLRLQGEPLQEKID